MRSGVFLNLYSYYHFYSLFFRGECEAGGKKCNTEGVNKGDGDGRGEKDERKDAI